LIDRYQHFRGTYCSYFFKCFRFVESIPYLIWPESDQCFRRYWGWYWCRYKM